MQWDNGYLKLLDRKRAVLNLLGVLVFFRGLLVSLALHDQILNNRPTNERVAWNQFGPTTQNEKNSANCKQQAKMVEGIWEFEEDLRGAKKEWTVEKWLTREVFWGEWSNLGRDLDYNPMNYCYLDPFYMASNRSPRAQMLGPYVSLIRNDLVF